MRTLLIFSAFTILLLSACMSGMNHKNISNVFDQKKLKEHVEFLSNISPARSYENIQSLDTTSEYIENEFIKYGFSPKHQTYEVEGKQYHNIIVSYGTPNAPVLIIGAHYDVCGEQPGADDNASGVASLLSLAQKISQLKPELSFRVDFVAFTLEEPPFFRTNNMGSYIHAKSLKENNEKVLGMVSLEMLGYFSSEEKSQNYPLFLMKLFYPSEGDFIAVVSNYKSRSLVTHFKNYIGEASINVEKLCAPSFLPGVDFSDHKNYWKFGYKAIMVTDTSFYRNPNYHMITDTPDTLDFSKMSEVTNGIYNAIIKVK